MDSESTLNRERGTDGQYVSKADPDEILALFDDIEGPVLTTGDVKQVFDVSAATARNKLQTLIDRGDVKKRQTAGVSVYWKVE